MWEITLVGKPNDIGYFLELKDYLKKELDNNVIVVISFENELICSIALSNEKDIEYLKNVIYETIIKIVKAEYYEGKLTIFSDDRSLNSFILSSIILINIRDEIEYAKNYVSLSKILYIRSFVNFKLHKLIDIWDREVEYYNNTFSGECRENLYLEFLRFLAHNSYNKQDVIYIEENQDKMLLLNNDKQAIKRISKNDEIGIIVQLIIYSPKKIIINCLSSLSQKVSNLISYIFEDKVSMLL